MSIKYFINSKKKIALAIAALAIVVTASSVIAFANKTANQNQKTTIQFSSLSSQISVVSKVVNSAISSAIQSSSTSTSQSSSQSFAVSSIISQNQQIGEVNISKTQIVQPETNKDLTPSASPKLELETSKPVIVENSTKVNILVQSQLPIQTSPQPIVQAQSNNNAVILTNQQPITTVKEATVGDHKTCTVGPNCISTGVGNPNCGNNCQEATIEPINRNPGYVPSTCVSTETQACATVEVPSK
jgi:hypothetical protein